MFFAIRVACFFCKKVLSETRLAISTVVVVWWVWLLQKLETEGFDPPAPCMRNKYSTNWATSPHNLQSRFVNDYVNFKLSVRFIRNHSSLKTNHATTKLLVENSLIVHNHKITNINPTVIPNYKVTYTHNHKVTHIKSHWQSTYHKTNWQFTNTKTFVWFSSTTHKHTSPNVTQTNSQNQSLFSIMVVMITNDHHFAWYQSCKTTLDLQKTKQNKIISIVTVW